MKITKDIFLIQKNTVCNVLENLIKKYPENSFTIALTGSGAMSASKFFRSRIYPRSCIM